MIYVDPLFVFPAKESRAYRVGLRHGHRWCHLWCDAGEEERLHEFAAKLGMKRAWYQDKQGFPHYDLVPPKRAKAVELGAVEMTLPDWLRKQKEGA